MIKLKSIDSANLHIYEHKIISSTVKRKGSEKGETLPIIYYSVPAMDLKTDRKKAKRRMNFVQMTQLFRKRKV